MGGLVRALGIPPSMTASLPARPRRSPERVRRLTAADMELQVPGAQQAEANGVLPTDPLPQDDPMLATVRELLEIFGGVIFVGPPGTSKSWYAARVGRALADGDESRVRLIQFHPSYQYEDFVEGFVPKEGGGFALLPKHLLQLCERASVDPDHRYIMVIDELSRGDPGRIFGEALTYVERTKRGLAFSLASGRSCTIPGNLVFLATMNPLDRGVDEVDAAFERRFGKIAMDPDPGLLEEQLVENGVDDALRTRILRFFSRALNRARDNPFGAIGHTFFMNVTDEASLHRLWDHQLRFVFEKAYQLDPDGLREIRKQWQLIFQPDGEAASAPDTDGDSAPAEG